MLLAISYRLHLFSCLSVRRDGNKEALALLDHVAMWPFVLTV